MRDVMDAKVVRCGAAVVAALAVWACPAPALAATTFTVTGTGDPVGAMCTGTVCPSLRAAVAAAADSPGSTVRLGATTYTLSQSALVVAPASGSMTIAGAAGTTIVQTHAGSRVVRVTGTEPVTISGALLTGGALAGSAGAASAPGGNADGAGISNASAPLTLVHVSVTGNTATGGRGGTGNNAHPFGGQGGEAVGGIYSGGRLTLIDSVVSSNVARAGRAGAGAPASGSGGGGYGGYAVGGVFAHNSSGPTSILGSTISGNRATGGQAGDKGGGLSAGGGGGAVGALDSDAQALTVASTTVASNSATGGAGITSELQSSGGTGYGGLQLTAPTGTALKVTGSTFSANVAQGGAGGAGGFADGGALTVSGMTGTVASSTITDNHATAGNSHGGAAPAIGGGGMFIEAGTTLTLTDTTIAQNADTGGANSSGFAGAVCGGGINNQGVATLVRDTITGNTANGGPRPSGGTGGSASGAGLCLYAFGTTVVNSTITGNFALGGGGGSSGGGDATGGGVALQAGPLVLASDTVSGNGATAGLGGSATGGNVVLSNPGFMVKLTLADTIVTNGSVVGGTSDSNCDLTAAQVVDQGHNLESTTPSQCGLGSGDVLGKNPLLGVLASNGGPTQTLALGAGSPALGAGGACRDPSRTGSPPLATDQRGLPRKGACDIGAFQAQRPTHTAVPKISGTAALGKVLTCSPGKWSGDGTLTFTYAWFHHGSLIAGAKSAKYTVAHGDIGFKVSCQVTATNKYGHATAGSASVSVPPKPSVGHVSQAHQKWRKSGAVAKLSSVAVSGAGRSKKHPAGTSFSFRLNTPSTVVLTFHHTFHGRTSGGNCVKQTRHNKHHRACQVSMTDGTLTFRNVSAGSHKIAFGGKLSAHKSLGMGSHTVTIKATNSSGSATSKALQFTIVKQ